MFNILLGGAAGQGIETTGAVIEKILKANGYNVFVTRDLMSRVRGGHNFSTIRFGREPVVAHDHKVDCIMAMNQETIDAYFDGMTRVINSYQGTGYSSDWSTVPVTVAGKTSTADQFVNSSANAAFVCFAPVEDPQIAIAIYVEKGGHGSSLTPIARAILREYFNVGTVSDVNTYENKLS